MIGAYLINDYDLFGTYGFVVTSGSNDFVKFPDRKPPISYDWADQNGIDVDLTSPRFSAKTISITGFLLGDNEADFWQKHITLFNLLAQPGTIKIYVAELSRTFFVFYQSNSNFDRLTRIKDYNGLYIGCKYTLTFTEPVPSFWNPSTVVPVDLINNTLSIMAGNPRLTLNGNGQITYTNDYYLHGKISYPIYSSQLGQFFRDEDIAYQSATGSFSITIPGFTILYGEKLLVFPSNLNENPIT